MKKILSTLVVAGAMIGCAAVSFGQAAGTKTGKGPARGPAGIGGPQGGGPGGPGGPGGGMRQRMMKIQEEIFAKLNLNAKQKEQLKALQKKNQAKMEAMRGEFQKAGGDRDAMRTKMQAVRKEQTDALKKILTADQFKKYETLLDAERKKMRAQFGGGRPGGAPGAGGPGVAGPRGGGPGAGGVKPGKGGA